MRRTYCLVLLFLCTLSAFSQTHIFYIDLSSRDSRLRHTSEHIIEKVQGINNAENFLFFLSNGGSPTFEYNRNYIPSVLDDLLYAPRPVRPSFYNDIDTLNQILSERNLLKGVNYPKRDNIEETIFYLYLNPFDPQLDDFLYRFLLTNRLLNKDGHLNGRLKIKVFFDCPIENIECQKIINTHIAKYTQYEFSLF